MNIIKAIAVTLMTVFALSCNQSDKNDMEALSRDIERAPTYKSKEEFSKDLKGISMDSVAPLVLQAGQPDLKTDWDKKIIKTAHVKLDVKDYKTFNRDIHLLIKRYGAYTASEQQTESNERIENNLSIKVPVDQFEDMMNALPGEGIKVLEKNITTEDVTGEVVDTKARMEAKKAMRDKYLEFMRQAKNMKDVLEVQNEINGIQETIEAGTGRVNYLVHQSAYSTINVNYFQVLKDVVQDEPSPTFFTKLNEAFKDGSSIVTGLLLLLVTFWPIWVAGLSIWFLVKKWKVRSIKVEANK